jgi:hypothetical protein
LRPEDEGDLYGSLEGAKTKLDEMLKERRARRGWLVSEIDDEDGRSYKVSNEQGRLVAIYYIEE